ncbi:hypothetical protein B0T11DRAFT_16802 [Plectosphaerella cucumerina]|uniref:Uncharacterized protein n=1 Tax=Plectosphaerella cucumerina TaxID=40658 RepID=A0A8K0TPL9_9PEZI|nr:hypothetical protein B0T11DRAFT_16802 [Plectosphaerella cucumerina]
MAFFGRPSDCIGVGAGTGFLFGIFFLCGPSWPTGRFFPCRRLDFHPSGTSVLCIPLLMYYRAALEAAAAANSGCRGDRAQHILRMVLDSPGGLLEDGGTAAGLSLLTIVSIFLSIFLSRSFRLSLQDRVLDVYLSPRPCFSYQEHMYPAAHRGPYWVRAALVQRQLRKDWTA